MSTRAQTNAGAWLEIRLDAICGNWHLLRRRAGSATCAAVVKADAYGLGTAQVAPALYRAGCRHFFVAHLDEGIALRPLLERDATVYVLHGSTPGAEPEFVAHGLVPVLNSLQQLDAWRRLAQGLDRELPAVLQVDTGMSRLGLPPAEVDAIAADGSCLQGVSLQLVMSHLASAEDQATPLNTQQLERFIGARRAQVLERRWLQRREPASRTETVGSGAFRSFVTQVIGTQPPSIPYTMQGSATIHPGSLRRRNGLLSQLRPRGRGTGLLEPFRDRRTLIP